MLSKELTKLYIYMMRSNLHYFKAPPACTDMPWYHISARSLATALLTPWWLLCHMNHMRHIHVIIPLHWRHNERDGVSNHQPHDCLLDRLLRRRSKKTSKRRLTGLCVGNSPVTDEFPAQRASNAETLSIWWRHHAATVHAMFWRFLEINNHWMLY